MAKRLGVLPAVHKDEHQKQFIATMSSLGYDVTPIKYRFGFPIFYAIKQQKPDYLILDWVHSFYTSSNLGVTLIKFILGHIDILLCSLSKTKIIWNFHNLHRHDKKWQRLEKICFISLSKIVYKIRAFNDASIDIARDYFGQSFAKKMIVLPQGLYNHYPLAAVSRKSRPNETTLLIFGGLRPGKGISEFLSLFNQVKSEDLKVIVAGSIMDHSLAESIKNFALKDPRIRLKLQFIPDSEVPEIFSLADGVVLPYTNILNSGIHNLCILFKTPIIANYHESFYKTLNPNYSCFFNLNDPQSLIDAISSLKKLSVEEIEASFETDANDREWIKIGARYSKLFD